jgi:hypothetical protein
MRSMTQPAKKKIERFYAEEAAKQMGKNWVFEADQEHPDFLINEDGQKFGLEVRELFTGTHNKSGSVMKQGESHTQKLINQIRGQYESSTNIPLNVKFAGNLDDETMSQVLPLLIAEGFDTKPVHHHIVLDTGKGLRVHVTKMADRTEWYNVMDRVGWVDQNPVQHIASAIEEKAKELPRYIETAGSDIRLLLVANRMNNSGKLMLPNKTTVDTKGFKAVYFYSYPETITILRSGLGITILQFLSRLLNVLPNQTREKSQK